MNVGNLEAGLRIFIVGFGGVFVNLMLIWGTLKILGWGVARMARAKEQPEKK
jgi:hypothetical protein